jgi:hypothetical protein
VTRSGTVTPDNSFRSHSTIDAKSTITRDGGANDCVELKLEAGTPILVFGTRILRRQDHIQVFHTALRTFPWTFLKNSGLQLLSNQLPTCPFRSQKAPFTGGSLSGQLAVFVDDLHADIVAGSTALPE